MQHFTARKGQVIFSHHVQHSLLSSGQTVFTLLALCSAFPKGNIPSTTDQSITDVYSIGYVAKGLSKFVNAVLRA